MVDLKTFDLLVQLGLVLDADVLHLLELDQVQHHQLFVEGEDVDEGVQDLDLLYLGVGHLLYLEVVTEHVVDYYHPADCTKYDLVQLVPHRQTTQRQTRILEPLLVVKRKVHVFALGSRIHDFGQTRRFGPLLVIFFDADVLPPHRDKVDPILHLGLHLKNLILHRLHLL